jgi:hypothetical protein
MRKKKKKISRPRVPLIRKRNQFFKDKRKKSRQEEKIALKKGQRDNN